MIDHVLSELGHDSRASRESDADWPRWRIRHGSAEVIIEVRPRAEFTHLRAMATVMTLDEQVDRAALYEHLLSQHGGAVYGAAFALSGDEVQLVAERSTIDLDVGEVRDLIHRVSTYADDYDDQLVARFGGSLGRSV